MSAVFKQTVVGRVKKYVYYYTWPQILLFSFFVELLLGCKYTFLSDRNRILFHDIIFCLITPIIIPSLFSKIFFSGKISFLQISKEVFLLCWQRKAYSTQTEKVRGILQVSFQNEIHFLFAPNLSQMLLFVLFLQKKWTFLKQKIQLGQSKTYQEQTRKINEKKYLTKSKTFRMFKPSIQCNKSVK